MESRRDAIKLALAGTVLASGANSARAAAPTSTLTSALTSATGPCEPPVPQWKRGIEGQRQADCGNGQFLNPVLAGDYPDPSILKDGDDYYMTHSSFDAAPGLLIWHSRDLVNWRPLGPALTRPLGTVFAVDIAKHGDRYFIYIPFMKASWSPPLASFANIYVIHASSMEGPWSEPIDLGIAGLIDPGHVVGEDGHRYLFFNEGKRVRLAADGLATAGAGETAYEAWHYPDDWITEAWSPEGPKLFRRGDWFYLVNAVGGTSGPATGHMIVVARSRSIHGPWEHCPHNPIVRTRSENEPWWSRGHATCVEGPGGRWFMVYHGYENGYHTLGRQTLLEPIEWTQDGWFRATGGDLSRPLPKPAGQAQTHGMAHSDFFEQASLGRLWSLYASAPDEAERIRVANGALILTGKGTGPADSSSRQGMLSNHRFPSRYRSRHIQRPFPRQCHSRSRMPCGQVRADYEPTRPSRSIRTIHWATGSWPIQTYSPWGFRGKASCLPSPGNSRSSLAHSAQVQRRWRRFTAGWPACCAPSGACPSRPKTGDHHWTLARGRSQSEIRAGSAI